MGYNVLFRQKCFLLSCLLTILVNFSNDKIVSVKNLVTYIFMTNPRVSFVKSFGKDRILVSNISKPLVLSQCTIFYKDNSHFKIYE